MGQTLRLYEVSLRDGLQNEPMTVSTADKLAHLHALVAAGFKDIEVTSFVRPDWIPQLQDAAEMIAGLPSADGVRFWALIPNVRGLERALEADVRHVATFISASESHNLKNVNRSVEASMEGLAKVIPQAKAAGCRVRSYVSTAFGCPFEGTTDPVRVVEMAVRLRALGADTIALGDTIGSGHPDQVRALIAALVASGVPIEAIAVHLHDTRGTALANAYAAWQAGVRELDGAIGGIGGCPYAPGAAGNAASEDLAQMFAAMGVETGVDLGVACAAAARMSQVLGRELPGRYYRYHNAFHEGR